MTTYEAGDKPLVVNRRRDGTYVLAAGWPEKCLLPNPWLLGHGRELVTYERDAEAGGEGSLTVRLVDAVAHYQIDERTNDGLYVTLIGDRLVDAPPVDETRAAALQEERRAAVIAEVAARYGVNDRTAERIAVDYGVLGPAADEGGE